MIARCLTAAAAFALLAGSARAEYRLHVLHVNDMHSRIEAITKSDTTCTAEDEAQGACFGGVARLVTQVRALRAELAGQNILTLDAGDQFQGSLMYTTYKGAVEAEFMEAVGFDAMAVGNHEFDDGPAGLAAFLDKVGFPVISGNTDVSAEPALAGRIAPHVVLEIGGERIGIVSALTPDTAEIASPGPTIGFADEIESLTADVAALTAQGVNKIIALTHVGYRRDIAIAAAVPGIDAVVGGHSHTYLSSSDRAADGPYPTWVSGPDDALVPVVQAYAYSKYLGHLELVFDDAGGLLDAHGDTILLDASVIPDPAIVARVAELAAPLAEVRARVVADAVAPIDGSRDSCRVRECAMGNLVADAMLARARGQGVSIAIQNGGGLRASIDAGPVTMGEVLAVLPFQNQLATFQLSGEDIVAALENGVSQVEDGAGRFAQVAGLRYSFAPASPKGARIRRVEVREGDGWVPITPGTIYGVVTNNYLRGGGDGYGVFAARGRNAYDFGPGLDTVVADYLSARQGYTPVIEGRVVVE